MNNISIGRYVPYDTFIHRLDPRSKIISMILMMVMIFFTFGSTWTNLIMYIIFFIFIYIIMLIKLWLIYININKAFYFIIIWGV